MERRPTPQDISWFLDLNKREQLDLDPPYQRKSVWTRPDKQYFLDTIFHNYPCPAVFLHKTISNEGETKYHVVDGKQRLQTILDFVKNEIAIPREFGDARLAGKKWNQLDMDAKKAFWNYLITVEMLPSVEDAVVTSIFERINKNARKLVPQELRHARFEGWLISRAEAEADKKEWKDFGVVTAARAKRMADVQFISELMLLIIKREIVGFDQDLLNELYAEYDVPSETAPTFNEADFDTAFESTKTFLGRMNDANESVARFGRTLAHFYSIWGYVSLAMPPNAEANVVATKYAQFMDRVSAILAGDPEPTEPLTPADQAVVRYARNARGAITDATPRRERHDALAAALNA